MATQTKNDKRLTTLYAALRLIGVVFGGFGILLFYASTTLPVGWAAMILLLVGTGFVVLGGACCISLGVACGVAIREAPNNWKDTSPAHKGGIYTLIMVIAFMVVGIGCILTYELGPAFQAPAGFVLGAAWALPMMRWYLDDIREVPA